MTNKINNKETENMQKNNQLHKSKTSEKIKDFVKSEITILKGLLDKINKIKHKKKIVDLLFITNPVAGDFGGKEKLEYLKKVAKNLKLSYHIVETKLKKDYIPKHIYPKIIVVIGGDGTLHLTINEMLKKEIDSFIVPIPSGTGNDFPSSQGMSKFKFRKYLENHHEKIKNNLLNELPFKFSDVGKIEYWNTKKDRYETVYFINVAGINSFDAEVVKNIYEMLKDKTHYKEDYILPVIKSIFTFKLKKYNVEYWKGRRKKRFKSETNGFLVYNNYKFAAGSLNLPEAKSDDGLLNIIFYRRIPKWNVPKHIYLGIKHYVLPNIDFISENFRNYFKNPKNRYGDVVRDTFKELIVKPVFIFQCDGELYDIQSPEMNISVLPKAIKILKYEKKEE